MTTERIAAELKHGIEKAESEIEALREAKKVTPELMRLRVTI